ncbi:50S ribosomal protein L11 methyltransferase, partial [Escherichia coli]|nr:50S ribosomal protein L11 methyltransferase [Escherichia coli]
HDRHRIPPNKLGIEIEAALAFGTGHHGTTRGCLLLLDHVLKAYQPRRVLDLGTGTGVLGIAAAKALHGKVLASDIDPP